MTAIPAMMTPSIHAYNSGVSFASEKKIKGSETETLLKGMDPIEMESLLDKLKHENELRTLDNPAYWGERFKKHPPKNLGEWKKYYTHGPGALRYKTPRLKRFFAFIRPKRLVQAGRDTLRMIKSLPRQDKGLVWGGLAWDVAMDGLLLLSTFGLWAIPMVMTTWGSNVAKRTFYHSVMSQYEKDRYGNEAATMPPIEIPKSEETTHRAKTRRVNDIDDDDAEIYSPSSSQSAKKSSTETDAITKHTSESTAAAVATDMDIDDGGDDGGDD